MQEVSREQLVDPNRRLRGSRDGIPVVLVCTFCDRYESPKDRSRWRVLTPLSTYSSIGRGKQLERAHSFSTTRNGGPYADPRWDRRGVQR